MKSKENGVTEYEDYERNLTEEQKEERERTLAEYEKVFDSIRRQ